jgi:hypothetical protein
MRLDEPAARMMADTETAEDMRCYYPNWEFAN